MALLSFAKTLMVSKEMQHLYLSSGIPPCISTYTRKGYVWESMNQKVLRKLQKASVGKALQ